MPLANSPTLSSPARLLFYGAPKTGKTWLASKAAEVGFNVIILDGDDGHQIISNMDMKHRAKIGVISLTDTPQESNFHNFIIQMSRGKLFAWSETEKRIVFAKDKGQFKPNSTHVVFNPSGLTLNDVLVIDSWSAFVRSMELYYKLSNNIKILEALKKEWDDYHWAKRLINEVMHFIHALPCHVVIIGHEHQHDIYQGKGKSREVVGSRIQPLSYSGPQGKQLAKEFSDILYFYFNRQSQAEITTSPAVGRDGGSRVLPPQNYLWKDFTWEILFNSSNGIYQLPKNPSENFDSNGIEFLEAGQLPSYFQNIETQTLTQKAATQKATILSTNNGGTKPKSLLK